MTVADELHGYYSFATSLVTFMSIVLVLACTQSFVYTLLCYQSIILLCVQSLYKMMRSLV